MLNKNKGYLQALKNVIFSQYKKYFEIIWIVGIDEIVGLYNRSS